MYETGKVHNTIKEMKRLNIKILGISEMRWPGRGRTIVDGHTIYYSGDEGRENRNGVAIIFDGETARSVNNVVLHSDRVIMTQLTTDKINMNIIQVYAPTCEHDEEEVEKFYEELEEVLNMIKNNEVIIIMGDMNAKIGEGQEGYYVGSHGLGERNERGDRFARFCMEKQLIITNTFFKLPKRRL